MLEIIQDPNSGEFLLKNWPRVTRLTLGQVEWIYPNIDDIAEFDMNKAKEYYN